MRIIAKYKFNQNLYENFIPEFNSGFTDYTITDEIDTDGFTIRTIESDSLPTLMRFGAITQTDREKSLLEVYKCNTENVTSMASMFLNCSLLTTLDTSNFDTSQVTDMQNMFYNCSSLTSLDVSNFDTSKVINMGFMFYNCKLLTLLDLSSFNTSKVTSMGHMFHFCSSLTSLDASNFDTSQVTNMNNMFNNCTSLTSLNTSNFDTSKVDNMSSMFQYCTKLASLDISNFNTSQVTNMSSMFSDCVSLTSLDVSNFNTSQVTNMNRMFFKCTKLISLNISNFDTSQVTNMSYMFYLNSKLTSLDVSNFNTSQVTNMDYMIHSCSSLTSLDLSNFNTSNVTNMDSMLAGCYTLTSLDVSSFNTSKVDNMNNMFAYCSSLTSLDVSNFDMSQVTYMNKMFYNCSLLMDIGTIYCNSSTINKISEAITTNTTIWYQDANLSDLTQLDNITYKKYKSTTLSLNEPIQLRSIGDVHDEINYETGEYIQRIGEMVLDGSEKWVKHGAYSTNEMDVYWTYNNFIPTKAKATEIVCDKLIVANPTTINSIRTNGEGALFIGIPYGVDIINYIQTSPLTVQYVLIEPIITKIDTTILDQNNSYKSSQQTYDESTYISVQSDTVVTPSSSVDYEIYSSTGTVTGTSATIENAEAGTPISGVVYGETLLNVIQEPSEDEFVVISDNFEEQSGTLENTVEGNIKSATLKGNTLVNLAQPSLRAWTMNLNSDTESLKATTEEFIVDWSKGVPYNAWITATNNNSPVFGGMLKADTDYTFIIRILENNPTFEGVAVTGDQASFQMWGLRGYESVRIALRAGVTGTLALKYKFNRILTTQHIENAFGISVGGTAVDGTKFIDGGKLRISKDIIVLEGDYTNNYQDIPYFEGMQSVNLYPDQKVSKITWKSGKYYNDNGELASGDLFHRYFDEYVEIHPNHVYTVSGNNIYKNLNFYDENKNHVLKVSGKTLWGDGSVKDDIYATAPANAKYIRYNMSVPSSDMDEDTTIFDTTLGIPLMKTSITRMPVLTTVGKNLFTESLLDEQNKKIINDKEYFICKGSTTTNGSFIINGNKIDNKKQVTFSFDVINPNNATWGNAFIEYSNHHATVTGFLSSNRVSITSLEGKTISRIAFTTESSKEVYIKNIQLEYNSTSTTYEPFKSNILTVNEEVHLHRIGDVQDELNVVTGELTQKFAMWRVTAEGSHWSKNHDFTPADGYSGFSFKISSEFINEYLPKIGGIKISCTPFSKWAGNGSANEGTDFHASGNGKFVIESSKVPVGDLEALRVWLRDNPVYICYELAQSTIKTVGLSIVDQDNKPTDNLHTFDTITHINTYAQGGGLIPFVSIPENISYDTLLKANTQYTIKLNRTNIVDDTPLTVNLGGTELSIEDSADSFAITTPSTLTNNTLSIGGANNKVKEVMVIEGDYVDRDLDFFEGFISVENPILATTGKNLVFLDKNNPDALGSDSGNGTNAIRYDNEKQAFYTDTHRGMCSNVTFKPNTYYIISAEFLIRKTSSYSFNWQSPQQSMGTTFTSDTPFNETTWVRKSVKRLSYNNGKIDWIVYGGVWFRNLQVEEAESLTEYEPYKGNTLTTHPQVTLRSIGDIKDEWDVVGETVTRRIGEIILDGSQSIGARHIKLDDAISDWTGKDKYLLSDKLPTSVFTGSDLLTTPTLALHGALLYVRGFNSNEEITEYFRNNPTTVQYRLATPVTESVRITPPNPQTSTASITIPTQLDHVEDTSDFLVWNPYKEHYVRYNYVEDGVVLDNYTWENLTDLNERQFVEFYNKRTYIDQPYHNYVASHDSKGTSKYVLIEPNQNYTVTVRFSELPTCETVKVNLGGAEVEMNVNDPHVHITTPNTLVNNLCSISGDGLDGKVTDILVIHCLEHEGFADIDYFEGIDGIGEIVEVEGVPKSKIIVEQTNGNLLPFLQDSMSNNGNNIESPNNSIRPNKQYVFKIESQAPNANGGSYFRIYSKDGKLLNGVYGQSIGNDKDSMGKPMIIKVETPYNASYYNYYKVMTADGSANKHYHAELCYADMEKDYIRPRYNDKEEILLPIQLHRINTVYDNFYYDEMKGYYRIQQSIGHKYFVGADSENWTLIERGQRVLRFRYNNADIQMKSLGEFMTNRLPNGTVTNAYECCAFNGINFIVSIDKERLSSESLTAFKEWLANNNLHLYYQLASPLMIDLPEYSSRIEFNTYKDEIYTFFKNCKPTVFTLGVPLDKTYRFYEYEESQGYANRVELTDERMTDEDTLYIDTIHGSGFSNLIENPNNVETLLKPNYQGKAVSHTLTNSKVSSIKVHGFEPNETTIANYNSTLKQYELIVQAQKGQNINTQTLAVPYKLEVYEDGTKDKVYYDEQNKVFRFEGGSVTNPPYNNSYIFNTPLEVFKGIAPRTGLIAEIKVKFNSGTTSARIYYSLDGGATTAYSTLRSMTDEVEYYIGFFNTGGTKLDYATKLSAEAEYINLAPLSSTLPESLIITQIQNISECTFTLDKTYYFDSWIKPLELDVYNGETIITEQSGAIVTINNNGLHKDALTYTDETYTVYWTYVGGEGNVTITLGGTKVEVVGTQGYATLKTAIDGVQDGLIIGGYNLSIKDLMLVKGERIEDLAYFEGSRAVGTAFVDENGETKYKITLVTGSELINDKFENRITFEDNNKHNVVVTKLLGNKPNKK